MVKLLPVASVLHDSIPIIELALKWIRSHAKESALGIQERATDFKRELHLFLNNTLTLVPLHEIFLVPLIAVCVCRYQMLL